MQLSVIIPCFNEEQNVPRYSQELWPVLESLGLSFEVVIVDDGSKDGTVGAVEALGKKEARLARHEVNQGLGAAVRTGITTATGERLVILDGDLTFHPKLIARLLEGSAQNPEADFIIGSPNLGGYGVGIPAWRLAISKIANFIYYILLGKPITSINQIFRLYKTADLQALPLGAVGFDINAEILFKLVFRGKRFFEVPAELTNRLLGVSKLNYAREIRRHMVLIFKILKWKFFGF